VLGKEIATGRRKRHEELLSSPKRYGPLALFDAGPRGKEVKEGKEREVLVQKKGGGPGGLYRNHMRGKIK
jgi:hypothetical protein